MTISLCLLDNDTLGVPECLSRVSKSFSEVSKSVPEYLSRVSESSTWLLFSSTWLLSPLQTVMINIFFKSFSFLRIAFFKASFLRTSFRKRYCRKSLAISWRQTTKNDVPDSRDRVPDVAASSPSYPYNHYIGLHTM